MSAPIIKAEGLGKEYAIGGRAKTYVTFRDVLSSSLAAPFHRYRNLSGQVQAEERFWALKDVSFEVQQGEVVGIIGRNGAGKSTLLKILSRITAPTKGRAEIRGRVASLLEVGTGFHPELTGRENIYLNGAILGMKRAEISRNFSEIVDFAGIEEFLDTPVKRYSSGMYLRLAFAVAAHLDPDILLVDEVLAVGDSEFQKKCLGKIRDTARSGRTIVFVSHNMNAIQALCGKCMLLDGGTLVRYDASRKVVAEYFDSEQYSDVYKREIPSRRKTPTIIRAAICQNSLHSGIAPALHLDLEIWSQKETATAIDVRLKDRLGTPVGFGTLGSLTPSRPVRLRQGITRVKLRVVLQGLALGDYFMSLDLNDPDIEYYDRVEDRLQFQLCASMLDGKSFPQAWGFGSSLIAVEQMGIDIGDGGTTAVEEVRQIYKCR